MKAKNLLIGGAVLAAGTVLIYKYRKTIPNGVTAFMPFDIGKFLGKWYEIARMDSMFEKHIDYATAEYSLNYDGSIKVINRGYNYKKQQEQRAEGKAVFVGNENEGKLKVSFFGPFYSGYNIIAVDPKYKYALVCGRNRNFLWILSKEKRMPESIINEYLDLAESLGFDTLNLVWTNYK